MKFGIGVEFQLDTLFKKTALKAVPAILDMMEVKSDDEFQALSAVTTATKKKIDCFAVLTPSLAKAIQSSNMTPSSVFIKIVEQIKVSMSAPGETEISTEETSPSTRASSATSRSSTTTPRTTVTETADQILIRLGTVYASNLRFLWAAEKIPNDIPLPTSSPLQDEDTLEWEAQTRKSIFPLTQTFDLNNSSQLSSSQLHDGAMTALTKLSMSIVKQQEAAIKNQEEKADTRLKSWRRLPKIQQNVIPLGGIRY